MSQWRKNEAQWYEERMLYCDLCGRMIAVHYLQAEVSDQSQVFCSHDCEQLYRDYWLVERGRDYRPPANVGELYDERMVK